MQPSTSKQAPKPPSVRRELQVSVQQSAVDSEHVSKLLAVVTQRDDAWRQLRERKFRDRKQTVEKEAGRRAHIVAVEER